jgi:hypothetical protein
MTNEIQAGTVWINGDIIGTPDYPWGGYKERIWKRAFSLWAKGICSEESYCF